MYVYIENETALNIIPDFDSNFPNVPVDERYSEEFLSHCEHLSDSADIETGMVRKNGVWSFPPAPVPSPEPAPTPTPEPIPVATIEELQEQIDMLTECVLEMSELVYAETDI